MKTFRFVGDTGRAWPSASIELEPGDLVLADANPDEAYFEETDTPVDTEDIAVFPVADAVPVDFPAPDAGVEEQAPAVDTSPAPRPSPPRTIDTTSGDGEKDVSE